ncbi:hypothetical protein [Paeniglutamicibacter sp. NPDC091659]|uniref:hypothetical protein n=1 Tax=Paeniglutamicibacter sp. NPDC091659 TaxID=3364389 RepID=UPI0037F5D784
MTTGYFKALQEAVVASSVSKNWGTAVLEWTVVDLEEDPAGQGMCVCHHPNLVEMFTIENVYNGNQLYPIGNVCVRKFGRQDLTSEANLFSQIHNLRSAINAGEDTFPKHFSRALLKYLNDEGVFTPDQWDHDGGYEFLVKMFNKRNKDEINSRRWWKIHKLLEKKIFPFILGDG